MVRPALERVLLSAQSGTAGAHPSLTTLKLDGLVVDNQQVIASIRQLLKVEVNALSYEYITASRPGYELKKDYLINKKNGAAGAVL